MELEHNVDGIDESDSDSSVDVDTLVSESVSVIKNDLKYDNYKQHFEGLQQTLPSVQERDGLNFVIDKRPDLTKLDASGKDVSIHESEEPSNIEKRSNSKRQKKNKEEVKQLNLDNEGENKHEKKTKKKHRKNNKSMEKPSSELSSSLQHGLSGDLYINTDLLVPRKSRQKAKAVSTVLYNKEQMLKMSVLPTGMEKEHSLPPYEVSLNQTRKQRKLERSQTKGPLWFDMKAPEMTEEKKNDLAVLQMRHVLDPKRFYKQMDIRGTPKFFQMGKIVEDATDFYSSRVPKKQRKQSLVDELLEDAAFKKYNKRKYAEILEKTQRSKGAFKHMKRMKKKKK